jgi:D-amino-acid dehydrogenase
VADQFVVAAGSHSPRILRRVGVRIPVQPAKGYSITLENRDGQIALRTPVVDDDWHAAIVPLQSAIRVAGTAEFTGYDRSIQPARIKNLVSLLRQVLPCAQLDPTQIKTWCGLRPMSADGVPIIGRTHIQNLLLNTGHGHLGWTMAAGSAHLLMEILVGGTPSIDPSPYSPLRFNTPRGADWRERAIAIPTDRV